MVHSYCSILCRKSLARYRGYISRGITMENGSQPSLVYMKHLLDQAIECAICGIRKKELHLDHYHDQFIANHWTGKHRGWLCTQCNSSRLVLVTGIHDINLRTNSSSNPLRTADLDVAAYLLIYHVDLVIYLSNDQVVIEDDKQIRLLAR